MNRATRYVVNNTFLLSVAYAHLRVDLSTTNEMTGCNVLCVHSSNLVDARKPENFNHQIFLYSASVSDSFRHRDAVLTETVDYFLSLFGFKSPNIFFIN